MTSYETIYKAFSKKINDIHMIDLSDTDIIEMTNDLMESAIPKFITCKSNLYDRDDDIGEFNTELLPLEVEILAMLMVSEWLQPQITSTELTQQFYSTKEVKFFAQSNQLDKLISLQHDIDVKAPKLMNAYQLQSFVIKTLGEGV